MVAQERHGRIEAEERLKSTEDNLAAAEAAMRDMQLHLQSMPTSAAPTAQSPSSRSIAKRRYLTSHLPYTEYSSFLSHLRSLRPLKDTSKNTFPPPLISALLTQAFLARTIAEDHDPTLRLDIAPDLSWLSRRGISSAIISGDLVIEPVSANTILSQTTSATHDIGCALCGKPVFPSNVPQSPAMSHFGPPPLHPTQRNSTSRFSLKPFFNASSPSTAPSPTQSPAASPGPAAQLPSVYIFRVARAEKATTNDKEKDSTKSYPLCRTGWCLERLRATCELWHFVRTGIVHVVWHGDDGFVLPAEVAAAASTSTASISAISGDNATVPASEAMKTEPSASGEIPPELPRRKSGWGLGFRMGGPKALKTGGSNSPPVSPRLPAPAEEKVGKVLAIPVEEERAEKLGAPLELEGEKVADGVIPDAPIVKEPTEPADVVAEPDEERPDIKRAHSAETLGSTDDPATFSTPQQESTALPIAAGDAPSNQPTEAEASHTRSSVDQVRQEVTLNSPKVDNPSAAASPSRPLPPPIPRRAAARNRASVIVDGPSQQGTPSGSGTATPAEAEHSTTADPAETANSIQEVSKEASSSIDVPPLPPRQPKTPTMPSVQSRQDRPEGERGYLKEDDDSWEAKTWRQLVKLKEEMWRRRTGVSDSLDE